MSVFQSLILGLVQGLTEFLPISSTAHLRVVPALLGWDDPGAAYSAIIQLGTTVAVVAFFAKDIVRIVRAFFVALKNKRPFETLDARMGWYVIIGTVPVVVAGLLLKKQIEGVFRSLYVIAFAAIGLAVLLYLAERLARHGRRLEDVGPKDAIAVGLAQAIALVPGSSRSGVTLTAGLFMGLERSAAARFSFLLSIPATAAAGLYELRHVGPAVKAGEQLSAVPLLVGTVSAFVFGFVSIAWLLRLLQTRTTMVFVLYRLAFGATILVLLWKGLLQP